MEASGGYQCRLVMFLLYVILIQSAAEVHVLALQS